MFVDVDYLVANTTYATKYVVSFMKVFCAKLYDLYDDIELEYIRPTEENLKLAQANFKFPTVPLGLLCTLKIGWTSDKFLSRTAEPKLHILNINSEDGDLRPLAIVLTIFKAGSVMMYVPTYQEHEGSKPSKDSQAFVERVCSLYGYPRGDVDAFKL